MYSIVLSGNKNRENLLRKLYTLRFIKSILSSIHVVTVQSKNNYQCQNKAYEKQTKKQQKKHEKSKSTSKYCVARIERRGNSHSS